MAALAQGRIVIWEGASLWIFRGGDAVVTATPHAHHAIQITLLLHGQVRIDAEGRTVTGPAAAVAADTSHVFSASGMVAQLFVEPESRAGRHFTRSWFGEDPLRSLDIRPVQALLGPLREAFDRGDDDAALNDLGNAILAALGGGPGERPVDRRVATMMEVASDCLDAGSALAMAASEVHLSNSRASHLFVEETGMPFKSYLLWRRLSRAVEHFAGGASLTEAAHAAGFSDSAHFSRTFRRMFGLTANSLKLMLA